MELDDRLVKHKYWKGEGQIVRVCHFPQIKSTITNVWFQGVEYTPAQSCTGIVFYVRPLADFLLRFEPHEILDLEADDI